MCVARRSFLVSLSLDQKKKGKERAGLRRIGTSAGAKTRRIADQSHADSGGGCPGQRLPACQHSIPLPLNLLRPCFPHLARPHSPYHCFLLDGSIHRHSFSSILTDPSSDVSCSPAARLDIGSSTPPPDSTPPWIRASGSLLCQSIPIEIFIRSIPHRRYFPHRLSAFPPVQTADCEFYHVDKGTSKC